MSGNINIKQTKNCRVLGDLNGQKMTLSIHISISIHIIDSKWQKDGSEPNN